MFTQNPVLQDLVWWSSQTSLTHKHTERYQRHLATTSIAKYSSHQSCASHWPWRWRARGRRTARCRGRGAWWRCADQRSGSRTPVGWWSSASAWLTTSSWASWPPCRKQRRSSAPSPAARGRPGTTRRCRNWRNHGNLERTQTGITDHVFNFWGGARQEEWVQCWNLPGAMATQDYVSNSIRGHKSWTLTQVGTGATVQTHTDVFHQKQKNRAVLLISCFSYISNSKYCFIVNPQMQVVSTSLYCVCVLHRIIHSAGC